MKWAIRIGLLVTCAVFGLAWRQEWPWLQYVGVLTGVVTALLILLQIALEAGEEVVEDAEDDFFDGVDPVPRGTFGGGR